MFSGLDFAVVTFYILVILGIGLWVGRKKNTSAEYFLADRNLGWFIVGAAIFASNIGSEHLVGLAGTGADSGIAVAQFELIASLVLLLLGWFFVPFYLSSKVSTMPEFLEKRYSPLAKWYLSIISIFAYIVTKISVTIAAGAIVFDVLMGIDFWWGALIIIVLTGLYTIAGGLKAVVITETIQALVLLLGSLLVLFFGLNAVGGWQSMTSIVGSESMSLFRPTHHPDFPWTGILLGAPILGIWYWCTDQNIVQRVLAAKNITEARRATIFAAFLKLLPLFIFVIPGVIAYALVQQGALTFDQPDQALPTLVKVLLPNGLKGLVAAGLLAALMSSLASVFNSCSTLITLDIYHSIFPNSTEKKLVLVGKVSTGFLVVLGLLFVPLIYRFGDTLFTSLQSIQAMISPPIAAVFLWGLLFKNLNSRGALWALGAGLFLGLGRFFLELNKAFLGLDSILMMYVEINFLHFAFYLFLICSFILFLFSTGPKHTSILPMNFWDRNNVLAGEDTMARYWDKGLSVAVVLAVLFLWILF